MEYRRLGNSGLKVSAISLGGWTTFGGSIHDQDLTRRIIDVALEGGVNFFDEADVYANGKSEEMMGAALRDHPRDRLVISSKLYWPVSDDPNDRGLSRKHIRHSIEKSLKRLGTDYLDLYFCHRYDQETPLEETVSAMSDLVHQGKILYWGTSEWSAAQITEAVMIARRDGLIAPIVEQPQYSMLHRTRVEKDVIPAAERQGVGLVVWSPLGMGVLTGKYDAGDVAGSRLTETKLGRDLYTPANVERVRRLKAVADELGVSRAALAVAWVLRQPVVASAIVGATNPDQMAQNLEAADFRLHQAAIDRVEEILTADVNA